jgi:hypothetical protein
MNSITRQYLFAAIFLVFGIFQAVAGDYREASLYIVAGLAFLCNTLTSEPRLITYKKALVITTWILIAAAGILFLYLLQFRFL